MAQDYTPPPVSDDLRNAFMKDDLDDPVRLVERVYEIWRHWADFHLYINTPTIPAISPPLLHEAELLPGSNEREFVYTIHDEGFKLSTSKSEDMFSAGMSMYKLFMTIEKMIYLLIERLKSGGIDTETEVQIAFGGHLIAQRKAFESVINLPYNIIVTNFDPGTWGDEFLSIIKNLADKGYGYPSETPRDTYKLSRGNHPTRSKI